jgi:hypothetical protein
MPEQQNAFTTNNMPQQQNAFTTNNMPFHPVQEAGPVSLNKMFV